jgi:hypothetical protein
MPNYYDVMVSGTTVQVASTAVTQQSPSFQYSAQRVYAVLQSAVVFTAAGTTILFVTAITTAAIPGAL